MTTICRWRSIAFVSIIYPNGSWPAYGPFTIAILEMLGCRETRGHCLMTKAAADTPCSSRGTLGHSQGRSGVAHGQAEGHCPLKLGTLPGAT